MRNNKMPVQLFLCPLTNFLNILGCEIVLFFFQLNHHALLSCSFKLEHFFKRNLSYI